MRATLVCTLSPMGYCLPGASEWTLFSILAPKCFDGLLVVVSFPG
jgi:hypothetical protein